MLITCMAFCRFQSTPSARRATLPELGSNRRRRHFNPRPPRGERHTLPTLSSSWIKISIHALREESDFHVSRCFYAIHYFNPRPPRGERPQNRFKYEDTDYISIHALREESDGLPCCRHASCKTISIHALREESDRAFRVKRGRRFRISIHALREESDFTPFLFQNVPCDFNPRPPRGERPGRLSASVRPVLFQSTPSARRATRSKSD